MDPWRVNAPNMDIIGNAGSTVHQTDDEKNIRIKLILSKNSENVSEKNV
jgi:hypothetical protein